ncbi:hypothetical protein [Kluyvera sichuanensis]|uniref:hypothetical protein n=1 Tax=Kluyvera sichuanensis TaxID=2725494 RepID=UPI002FCFCF27
MNNEEALSKLAIAESNLLKAKERLDYLTRKTYLIKVAIKDKTYFLCGDDSLSEKFGNAIKFKKMCDAKKELMLWLEIIEATGNEKIKTEIVIEKDLLRNFISHTKNQINN